MNKRENVFIYNLKIYELMDVKQRKSDVPNVKCVIDGCEHFNNHNKNNKN